MTATAWILAAAAVAAASVAFAQVHPDTRLELGRLQYELAKSDSRIPRYGGCWKAAVRDLEDGCKRLTDDEQSFLALQFANCFLEKSGQQTHPCPRGKRVRECLEGVGNNAFTAYSNFYTHTQNMCFFLESQVWHEETEDKIRRLSEASSSAAEAIDAAARVQEQIAEKQKESLSYQRELAANGSMLSQALDASRASVREMLAEFKTSTDEQRTLIFEIFDRVAKLQNLVVGELSWLYTVVFYAAATVVVYIMTATRRTSDARLWLYCVLSANFVVERMICNYSLQDTSLDPSAADPAGATLGGEDGDTMSSEALYLRIWLARKVSVLVCVGISSCFAFTFIDYNKANHRLLEDIRQQNVDLKNKMELMQVSNKPSGKKHRDLADGGGFPEKALVDPFTGGADDDGELADESSDNDDDDTLSFDSTATDRTWYTSAAPPADSLSVISSDDDDDEVNEEDFLTALNSNNNSPDIPEELAKLSATPVALDDGLGPLPAIRKSSSRTPSRRASRSSRASTPAAASPNHSYNLRNRRSSLGVNPDYENETERDFVSQVRKMLKRSDRNKVKIAAAEKRSHIGAFSSDEA